MFNSEARNFYMTDMINKLIKDKYQFLVQKTGQWLEIDTEADLNLAFELKKPMKMNFWF